MSLVTALFSCAGRLRIQPNYLSLSRFPIAHLSTDRPFFPCVIRKRVVQHIPPNVILPPASSKDPLKTLSFMFKKKNPKKFSGILKGALATEPSSIQKADVIPLLNDNFIKIFDERSTSIAASCLTRLNLNCQNTDDFAVCITFLEKALTFEPKYFSDYSSIMSALIKCQLKLNLLSEENQEKFFTSLTVMFSTADCRHFSNLLHVLYKMDVTWSALPNDLQSIILKRLVGMTDQFSAIERGIIIFSLGGLQFPLHTSDEAIKQSVYTIARDIYELKDGDKAISYHLGNTLIGLSRMSAKYQQMPSVLQQVIQSCFIAHWRNLNPQNIANSVYSLGIMEASFPDFSSEAKGVLFTAITRNLPQMTTLGLSTSLYGLQQMGMKWNDENTPIELKTAVCDAFVRCGGGGNCSTQQQSSYVQNSTNNAPSSFNQQELSNILYALGCSGAKWSDLPLDVHDAVGRSIQALDLLSNQALSTTIYGLARMEAKWSQFNFITVNALLHHLSHPLGFSDDKFVHVSTTIWSLAKMEATWADLPTKSLLKAVTNVCTDLDSQGIANIVWGLGSMNALWDKMPRLILQKAICSWQGEMSPQELSNILLGLAYMQASWDDLSGMTQVALTETVLQCSNEQDHQSVCNSMHAVTELCYDATTGLKQLNNLTNHLLLIYQGFNEEIKRIDNISQVTAFLEWMHVKQPNNSKITDSLNSLRAVNITNHIEQSKGFYSAVHHNVSRDLSAELSRRSGIYRVEKEFHGLKGGVMPVDCAVYYKDKLIALIEIDGTHHYTSEGDLKRGDELKSFLYARNYPHLSPILRVINDEIIKKGSLKVAEELAERIATFEK